MVCARVVRLCIVLTCQCWVFRSYFSRTCIVTLTVLRFVFCQVSSISTWRQNCATKPAPCTCSPNSMCPSTTTTTVATSPTFTTATNNINISSMTVATPMASSGSATIETSVAASMYVSPGTSGRTVVVESPVPPSASIAPELARSTSHAVPDQTVLVAVGAAVGAIIFSIVSVVVVVVACRCSRRAPLTSTNDARPSDTDLSAVSGANDNTYIMLPLSDGMVPPVTNSRSSYGPPPVVGPSTRYGAPPSVLRDGDSRY